ncbi:MAG: phage tail protein, partial [Saprospiraceae bacterium]
EGFFMAQITLFAGTFAPLNWAFCHGQLLSIDDNTALFALIGTIYGGDGITTFGLPDFRGRIPIGEGQGPGLPDYGLGEASGAESVTITTNTMASHTHTAAPTVPASTANASSNNPNGNVPAATSTNFYAPLASANSALGGVSATVQNAGGATPVSLGMPALGLNFVIALEGIFPSRN